MDKNKCLEAINKFNAGEIDRRELAHLTGRFVNLFFEELPSGNFRAFKALTPDGFSTDHPLIEQYQDVPESEIPSGSKVFVST